MDKKDKSNYKKLALQVLKNTAAVGGGTALGYFGTATLANRALRHPAVVNRLARMSPAERTRFNNILRTGTGLAGGAASALSSMAIRDALNAKTQEKTAGVLELLQQKLL